MSGPGNAVAVPVRQVRLLLVDDHGLFREGLSRLLEDQPDLALVAQCSSTEEVHRAFDPSLPGAALLPSSIDLMLLDFDLSEETGLDALQSARYHGFQGKVLLVTAGMDAHETLRAFDEGVSGIFLKHRPPSELIAAIRQVVAGEPWPDRASVARLLAGARAAQAPKQARMPQPLTLREKSVLRGVFEGHANKEIARDLEVSEGSVKAVLQQLFAKTGVRSRAQLVRIALENRYEYQLELG